MSIHARHSFYEEGARARLRHLLDAGTFHELVPFHQRVMSPHLASLGIPGALDDGVVVGAGLLRGKRVLIASQEGDFIGGAVGEVHGAKLTGLLERALKERPDGVILVLDSGGVRLHEANAGLIAISEIMRALLALRLAGIACVGLIGSENGCFGGMSIVARLCSTLIMSEEGRLGLSGPEVIETVHGVEEFDSRDRALVWRTVGGKHRYLLDEANVLVDDDMDAFREAASQALGSTPELSLDELEAEHRMLADRLDRFGECRDGIEIWRRMGIGEPERLPLLDAEMFMRAGAEARR